MTSITLQQALENVSSTEKRVIVTPPAKKVAEKENFKLISRGLASVWRWVFGTVTRTSFDIRFEFSLARSNIFTLIWLAVENTFIVILLLMTLKRKVAYLPNLSIKLSIITYYFCISRSNIGGGLLGAIWYSFRYRELTGHWWGSHAGFCRMRGVLRRLQSAWW